MRFLRSAAIIFLIASLAPAEHGRRSPGRARGTPRSVVGGAASRIPQVVRIAERHVGTRRLICSGTIAGPRSLVLAAHCFGNQAHGARYFVSAEEGGPDDEIECRPHPDFPQPSPADIAAFQDTGRRAIGACRARAGEAELAPLVEAHLAASRKVTHIETKAELDVAVCRKKHGQFSIPPARIAAFEPKSKQVQIVGFGCHDFDTEGPIYSWKQRAGRLSLAPDQKADGPFIDAEYVKDDPERSGGCMGDSGGAYLTKHGEGVELVGIVSSGTSAGEYEFDARHCAFGHFGSQKGETRAVNLSSPTSRNFLAALEREGFELTR